MSNFESQSQFLDCRFDINFFISFSQKEKMDLKLVLENIRSEFR